MSDFYARFPFSEGREVVVAGKLPLTEDEWMFFLGALTALRPAFTATTTSRRLAASETLSVGGSGVREQNKEQR